MHWFESSEHALQALEALRKGKMPLKYAYSGSAASTHDALAQQASYHEVVGTAQVEADALRAAVREGLLPSRFTEFHEIGAGNGLHTDAFLRLTSDVLGGLTRYRAYDFSASLLHIVAARLRTGYPHLEVSTQTWDIEVESLQDPLETVSGLVGLLGHTIGNVEDPLATVRNLRRSIGVDIPLLVSFCLLPDGASEDDICEPYRNKTFHDAALEPLRALGLSVADERFRLSFDRSRNAVVGFYTSGTAETLKLNGSTVRIHPDQPIECFLSRRFRVPEIVALFDSGGFDVLVEQSEATESVAALVCL